MALKKSWLRENIASFLIAIVGVGGGVGGAFIGSYYGTKTQTDLWRKEKQYQYTIEVLNKRIEHYSRHHKIKRRSSARIDADVLDHRG